MCSKWYSQAQWWDSGGRHRERGHAVIILLLQSLMCRFSRRIMVAFRCIRMGDVGVASTDPKNITVNISSQPCMTQEVVWGSLTILPYIYTYVYIYIFIHVYIYIYIYVVYYVYIILLDILMSIICLSILVPIKHSQHQLLPWPEFPWVPRVFQQKPPIFSRKASIDSPKSWGCPLSSSFFIAFIIFHSPSIQTFHNIP